MIESLLKIIDGHFGSLFQHIVDELSEQIRCVVLFVDEVLEGLFESLLEHLRVLEIVLHDAVEPLVQGYEIENEFVLSVNTSIKQHPKKCV